LALFLFYIVGGKNSKIYGGSDPGQKLKGRRSCHQVVKLFDVFRCQFDQVSILTVIPNLFNFLAPSLRLLTTPTASVENLPDTGWMIPDTETPLDYLGYPWQCPQLIFIPMSQRPFQK
jgi:hypothetical protein